MSCERNIVGLCGDSHFGQVCADDCPRLAVVNRLVTLTDGKVTVSFAHNTILDGDEDRASMGHLWHGWLNTPSEDDAVYLDLKQANAEGVLR